MKRAFILHFRAQDTSACEIKVDETKIVVDGKFYPFDPGDLYEQISEVMSHFDTANDLLVPCGSNLVCFLAGFFLGRNDAKRLKMMIHDVKTNRYREVVFVPKRSGG